MKRTLSVVLLLPMLLLCVGCNAYSGEIEFFSGNVHWDMTMMEAYDYIQQYDIRADDVGIVTGNDDSVDIFGINGNYTFHFNFEGRLTDIGYDMGEDPAAPDLVEGWLGPCDKSADDVNYWYRTLDGVDTDAELHLADDTYTLVFKLADDEKRQTYNTTYWEYYDKARTMAGEGDFDTAEAIYDFLVKAQYPKTDLLRAFLNESKMQSCYDAGDCHIAWEYRDGVDEINPDLYKACAYSVAVAAFDTTDVDAMASAVAVMKEHCNNYRDTASYCTYYEARCLEATDPLGAAKLYEQLSAEFLDVGDRLR